MTTYSGNFKDPGKIWDGIGTGTVLATPAAGTPIKGNEIITSGGVGYMHLTAPKVGYTKLAWLNYTADAAPVGTGVLQGTVTDKVTALPLAGVSITAGGLTGSTNADGLYQFASAPAGVYNVTTSPAGYVPFSGSALVTTGATTILDIALQPVLEARFEVTLTKGNIKFYDETGALVLDKTV